MQGEIINQFSNQALNMFISALSLTCFSLQMCIICNFFYFCLCHSLMQTDVHDHVRSQYFRLALLTSSLSVLQWEKRRPEVWELRGALQPPRFISAEQPGAVPPALRWPHTSRLVWAHIKCFSHHPPRPLKVNNPLRSGPIPHTWQVSVCTEPGRCARRVRRRRSDGVRGLWLPRYSC